MKQAMTEDKSRAAAESSADLLRAQYVTLWRFHTQILSGDIVSVVRKVARGADVGKRLHVVQTITLGSA